MSLVTPLGGKLLAEDGGSLTPVKKSIPLLIQSDSKSGPQRVKITTAKGYVILEALKDDLVHIEMSAHGSGPGIEKAIYTSPLVLKHFRDFPGPNSLRIFDFGFETEKLIVKVDSSSMCIAVYQRSDDSLLNNMCSSDLNQATKHLKIDSPQTKNIYGLGQYMSDPMALNSDWNGKVWEPGPFGNFMRGYRGGATANTQIPILYALGSQNQAYALFFDHLYRQKWSFVNKPWDLETWGDQIRYYVISEDSLASLRRTYLELTGKPPLPAKQLLGMWASEFGYDNWQEVYRSIDSLKKAGYPLDGLALDLQWYGTRFNDPDHSTMGSLRWDQSQFPDPEIHIKNLSENYGLKLMLIEQPYISSALSEYNMLNAQGMLVRDCGSCGATYITYSTWWGRGGMLDFTNPRTNDFWHNEKRQKLIKQGIYGHWTDLGEPEMYHANAYYYGFPELGLHQHGDVHNIYNFKWVEGIYQGYRKNNIDERPIILTRSGNAGIQRFNTAMWSGDIGANLDSMRMQIQSQMNMSLSGVDYYGSDVGGFYRASGDGKEDELYSMWFANAALFEIPVRVHVWNLDNAKSSLPSKNGHSASNLQNIRMRYELIPYYYSLAYQAYKNADPIIAPMVYYWQHDSKARIIADQKTLGPNLLGALVTRYGAIARDVYLPAGKWYDFYNHAVFEGQGQTVKNYPLFRDDKLTLPLFARAGAIIPKMPVDSYMMNAFGFNSVKRADTSHLPLVIRFYPDDKESSFTLYEDDGHTFAYEKGAYRMTRIVQKIEGNTALLTIAKSEGNYVQSQEKREVILELVLDHFMGTKMSLNGSVIPACPQNSKVSDGQFSSKCFIQKDKSLLKIYLGELNANQDYTFSLTLSSMMYEQELAQVTFACEDVTTKGKQSVFISGNISELGEWDLSKAVPMSPNRYPTWSKYIENLPAYETIVWKCLVRDDTDPSQPLFIWQSGGDNEFQTQPGFNGLVHAKFPQKR